MSEADPYRLNALMDYMLDLRRVAERDRDERSMWGQFVTNLHEQDRRPLVPPIWASGTPYYCDCGCNGTYNECMLPNSVLEPQEDATRRHAHWCLKCEFDR